MHDTLSRSYSIFSLCCSRSRYSGISCIDFTFLRYHLRFECVSLPLLFSSLKCNQVWLFALSFFPSCLTPPATFKMSPCTRDSHLHILCGATTLCVFCLRCDLWILVFRPQLHWRQKICFYSINSWYFGMREKVEGTNWIAQPYMIVLNWRRTNWFVLFFFVRFVAFVLISKNGGKVSMPTFWQVAWT